MFGRRPAEDLGPGTGSKRRHARRVVDLVVQRELPRARRRNYGVAFLLFDLDNFKDINDNYGHPHGDEVIRVIGQRLRDSLRKYDHAGRYGGEEFICILPETGRDGARRCAERLRVSLSKEVFEDGIVEATEACDPAAPLSETCQDYGYNKPGDLACRFN